MLFEVVNVEIPLQILGFARIYLTFGGTPVLLFGHVLPQGPKTWRLRNSGESLIPTE